MAPCLAILPRADPAAERQEPVNGIAALVGHVDEIVALYDVMFAGPPAPAELPAFGRPRESRSETWCERFDGVASVFVLWTTTATPRDMRRTPAIAFHGAPPKQWTPARAEHEARWASRDAIVNAIGKARQEGATGRAIAGRVAHVYGGWLELRARLVDRDTLRGLFAAAVGNAMTAGTLAETAVNALRHELGRLFDDGFHETPGDYGHFGFKTAEHWRTLNRLYLRPALENARVYADAIGQRESAGQPGASVSSPVSTQAEAVDDGVVEMARHKRSTVRGEARDKLVAGLTEHHRYADGSCLVDAPIGCNELARKMTVSQSTASAFFDKNFGDWEGYRRVCGDKKRLLAALKLMNNEFTPRHLLLNDVGG